MEPGGDQAQCVSDARSYILHKGGPCLSVFFREFNKCGVDLSIVCLDLLVEIHVVGT